MHFYVFTKVWFGWCKVAPGVVVTDTVIQMAQPIPPQEAGENNSYSCSVEQAQYMTQAQNASFKLWTHALLVLEKGKEVDICMAECITRDSFPTANVLGMETAR